MRIKLSKWFVNSLTIYAHWAPFGNFQHTSVGISNGFSSLENHETRMDLVKNENICFERNAYFSFFSLVSMLCLISECIPLWVTLHGMWRPWGLLSHYIMNCLVETVFSVGQEGQMYSTNIKVISNLGQMHLIMVCSPKGCSEKKKSCMNFFSV